MRMFLVAAPIAAVFALGISVPASASVPLKKERQKYLRLYHAVKQEHGDRAPGRQILKHGVKKKGQHSRPATAAEVADSIRHLREMHAPHTRYLSAVPPSNPPDGSLTMRNTGGLPWCTWGPESGGSYQASNGTHFGKYQFDIPTWQSVGGVGNPLNASPAEQDKRAAMLYSQRGGQPWVNC